MDRLERLRLFVTVAEQQSFAAAARLLRVSPAAATRAVAALEASLGAILLRRTTRSVRLTEAGTLYLEHCRHALAELDDAARALRGQDAAPHGTLVMTAPVLFGRLHVLPAVAHLLRTHPALDVRLTLTDRVVRLVEEGIDLAVRIAHLPDSALHAVRVAEVRRVLVASPAYVAEHGPPRNAADLRAHALIAFDSLSPGNEWRFGTRGRPAVKFRPRLLTNSVDAAIGAALMGCGIARVLSYQVADHIAAGRLVPVLAALSPPPVPVHLVFQANRHQSAGARQMVAAIMSGLAGSRSL